MHLAPKKDGTWRPCGNYHCLNDATVRDSYPLPHIHHLMSKLLGATIFRKMDLVKGYHQIPVHKNDVKKMAIATPFGMFEFLRMPFGLKNAAQTFQSLMDEVTQDLPGVSVYLDDVLVASRTVEDHVHHLRGLCQALKRFGLVVNQAKCVFGVDQLEFLGHKITRHGIAPLPGLLVVQSLGGWALLRR